MSVSEFRREDLDDVIVGGDGNSVAGFRSSVEGSLADGLILDVAIDGNVIEELRSWYPAEAVIGDVPAGDLRERVHGSDQLPAFLVEGYTAYHRLNELLLEVADVGGDEPIRLLDWGVGCGRVARYFVADRRYITSGADIDGDNIRWCREHLAGRFEHIDPRPPTPFEDRQFDAIIGVSVMTHLDAPLQIEWLQHLRSLLRPGGVALLSAHGWTTARRSGLPSDLMNAIGDGFLDAGVNPNIPASVVESGYYRNVFNTPEQIMEQWGAILDVESIRPALIGQHQDVVVLRRPHD